MSQRYFYSPQRRKGRKEKRYYGVLAFSQSVGRGSH